LKQYLTIKETAQLLDVTERTVRRLAKRGLLTKFKSKGKVLFRPREVEQLNNTRSSGGTLGVIYKRVEELSNRQAILEARVAILEVALSSRQGYVDLSKEDISKVRTAIIAVTKQRDMDFSSIAQWADDLIRLDRNTCKAIGIKRVKALIKKLISIGDELPEVLRDPSKSIYLDKLALMLERLNAYSKS
jgi:excisionase family DNA binding protein